jgi:hypothetical protein
MHACFHGGGGASRVTKSVGIIAKSVRRPTSIAVCSFPSIAPPCVMVTHMLVLPSRAQMKVLSLIKERAAGGGDQPRRRRSRHPHRSPKAEDPQDNDVEAASSASSSAKVAPAQPHEADGDREDSLQPHEEPERGGAKHERCDKSCDKCCSHSEDDGAGAADDEEDSDREWAAEPEPGVLMTLVSRGDGTNHLRRIRFSEDYFGDAWAAQSWWADNCDRIVELYSVVVQTEHPSHGDEDDDDDPAAPVTPCPSEDDDHQPPVRDSTRPDFDSIPASPIACTVEFGHLPPPYRSSWALYSCAVSATRQQYFSLTTNQLSATCQQYFSLRTNQHQPSATSQTNTHLISIFFKSMIPCSDRFVGTGSTPKSSHLFGAGSTTTSRVAVRLIDKYGGRVGISLSCSKLRSYLVTISRVT